MNDNDPFGAAERNLHSFIEDRYPDRAAAQRTIVRLSIHQRSQRQHLRLLLLDYVSVMKWFKPLALAVVFFAGSTYLLRLSSQGLSAAFPASHEGLAFAFFVALHTLEKVLGKPVHRGSIWKPTQGWHFELSPAFKRMYRASHNSVQAWRKAGTR